jgi:hypothetical protein
MTSNGSPAEHNLMDRATHKLLAKVRRSRWFEHARDVREVQQASCVRHSKRNHAYWQIRP